MGYVVRDENVAGGATRIVFAAAGMTLRNRALLGSADTAVIDEFHERNLEIDALNEARVPGAIVTSSWLMRGSGIAVSWFNPC